MPWKDAFHSFPILESGRLLLRNASADDVESLWAAYSSLKDVPHWDYTINNIDDVQKYIIDRNKGFEEMRRIWWLITLKPSGDIAGGCSISYLKKMNLYDLGYWIAKPHWGKGIATEASELAISYAFGKLGLPCLIASVHKSNTRSLRVMEKTGFVPIKKASGEAPSGDELLFKREK
jgi:ribosomal-protein-alanine N-acetyltransferase